MTAKSRLSKTEYTMNGPRPAQIHGLDAETELLNILSAEILEINREVVRTIYINAEIASDNSSTHIRML